MKFLFSICFAFGFLPFVKAQNIPIGNWKEYLPYRNPIAVTESDNKIYCATSLSLYSVDKSDKSLERYSKVTGLSDIGYSAIAFDKVHELLLIAYSNSNIDLMKGNKIINIPDIKRKNVVGDKSIYHIFFSGNFAYLSCGFGIVVVDLIRDEISDTYFIGTNGDAIRVNSLSADKNNFFAATEKGIFTADKQNPNLSYYANWKNISAINGLPGAEAKNILNAGDKILCVVKDSLFQYDGSAWKRIYTQNSWKINGLSLGKDGVIVEAIRKDVSDAKLVFVTEAGQVDSLRDKSFIRNPMMTIQESDGSLWHADLFVALSKLKDNTGELFYPDGPTTSKVNDIAIFNHRVYIAPGGVSDWNYSFNRDGFFIRINDSWNTRNQYSDPQLDSLLDIFVTTVNPSNGFAYFGSYGGGVAEFNNVTVSNVFKQNTGAGTILGDPGSFRASGIAFDEEGNMWVSFYASPTPLCVRTTEGKWYTFKPTVDLAGNQVAQIVVDQNNYKWVVIPRINGIMVYDSGDKIDDPSDDRYKKLGMGIGGNGGLPNLAVNCLAADKDGQIWVGTDQGVAVYYCPSEIFSSSSCDAQQILVKEDQYYNYLLVSEVVHDIAIDGANRKWFATDNGVFLMSADGTQQIYHFTESNSPLFSNFTTSVAVDDQTGEVFIGTDKGLEVFRSEATDEDISNCNPFVYPNPVREDYTGPIAIKGLVSNSEVKITDVAGNLVYQTKALGTQAIWDGKTLKGERAATGVYLVFAASPDGTKSCITKLVLIN